MSLATLLPQRRFIVLGASNCARGLPQLVQVARQQAGGPIDLFAALGHGRSYAKETLVVIRKLPGILQCGLWQALSQQPPLPSVGLITDVGNDLLYGAEPSQIENWVATCLARLGEINAQLILTELPLANLQHLSPRKFTFFSKLFFPFCQLSLSDARNKASELNQRLLDLAARFGASTIKPDPTWYGFDPIHIRYAKYPCAWSQILGAVPSAAPEVGASPVRSLSALTRMRIAWVAPHRRQLLHWVQSTMQPSMILADGSRIAVY